MARLESMKTYLPKRVINSISYFNFNFYRVHLVYFISVILLTSVIVYGSTTNGNSNDEEKEFRLSYIDALYLCASAMTSTGLNVIDLSSLTGFQQAVLLILIPMGNVMVVSTSMVYIRRYWFRRKIFHFLEHSKVGRAICEDIELQENHPANYPAQRSKESSMPLKSYDQNHLRQRRVSHHHLNAYGGFPLPWQSQRFKDAIHHPFRRFTRKSQDEPHDYLSFQPALDNKGRIHSLDDKQKTELGGVEYRALKLLSWLLPVYIASWFLLGIIVLIPYSYYHSIATIIRDSQPGNLDPGWWATFQIVSSLGNCGMSLLDENMTPFQGYYLVLILVAAVSLAGEQLFPVFLRFSIWLLHRFGPKHSHFRHTCAFLLHHPRRCFILLFPSDNTWLLLAVQLAIDFVLWAFFGILNIGLPAISHFSAGKETIMGLFQALGTRFGGLYVVDPSDVAPALQIMYLIAMYLSAFPIIVSLRQTNIYEERSLGIDGNEERHGHEDETQNYLGMHIKRQLAYDLWWLALAVFLITIIERDEIVSTDPSWSYFTIWAIMFEVFSAYGTVGLSLGVPTDNYSFSGVWHTLSKLILVCVMIRGRHRGLPYAIDRAVLLPGEDLMERMDHEVDSRGRRQSMARERREKLEEEKEQQDEAARRGQGGNSVGRDLEDERLRRAFAASAETSVSGSGSDATLSS